MKNGGTGAGRAFAAIIDIDAPPGDQHRIGLVVATGVELQLNIPNDWPVSIW